MSKFTNYEQELLEAVADLHEIPEGAYNIRRNGESMSRRTTDDIDIIRDLNTQTFEFFFDLDAFETGQLTETHLYDSVSLLFGETDSLFKFKVGILFAHSTAEKL